MTHRPTTQATTRQRARDGLRYYNKPFGIPRSIPAGRVLAHNHVQHTVDMPHGVNGFRCWTWPQGKVPRKFKRCGCGWSGLPHYRVRGDSKRVDALLDRCISQARLNQNLNGTVAQPKRQGRRR